VDAASVFIMFLAIAFFGVIVYLATASRVRDTQVQPEQHSSGRLESERRKKAA